MRWTEAAKREAAIRAPMGPGLWREDTRVIEQPGWYQLITPSAPGTVLNEVIFSRVQAEDAERVIDEVIATHRSTGHPVKWCVGPWTEPADFGERLARRGFRSWRVRGMCRATERSGSPAVEEVEASTLEGWLASAHAAWGLPPTHFEAEMRAYRAALSARPRLAHFFGIREGGEWLGTAALLLRPKSGYLLGTQVVQKARGRGLYRALVAARLRFLAERGITLAVTQAREETSAPILERLGFETVFRSRCYVLD